MNEKDLVSDYFYIKYDNAVFVNTRIIAKQITEITEQRENLDPKAKAAFLGIAEVLESIGKEKKELSFTKTVYLSIIRQCARTREWWYQIFKVQ